MSIITIIPDDLSIPEFLKRKETPESKEARERLIKELTKRGYMRRLRPTKGRSTISTGYAANIDDVGKAMLREVLKDERVSDAQKDRARRALREGSVMQTQAQVGPKEQALREARKGGGKKETRAVKLANDSVATSVGVKLPSSKTNGNMSKTQLRDLADKLTAEQNAKAKTPAPKPEPKPEPKAAAKKVAESKPAAKPVEKASKPAKPSKMQKVEDMLLAKNGASREEMSRASGWPYVNLDTQLERYRKRFPKAKLVETNGRFKLVATA